jgi:hypothetical protein
MTMALDVVAFLEHAIDDAKAMNFAGLCYPVTGSVIVQASNSKTGSSFARRRAKKPT